MKSLLTKQQVEELRSIDTPTLCNAIESFNIRDRTEGFLGSKIRSITPEFGTMFGYAVTALVDASTPGAPPDPATWKSWVMAMFDAPKPCVLVFKDIGPNPEKSAHCGEVMATLAKKLGTVGLITDGGVRDINEVKRLGFHYFAAGLVPAHGTTRFIEVNVPVEIDGVTVKPGDLIHADVNGVTTLPVEIVDRIMDAVMKVRVREAKLMEYMKSEQLKIQELIDRVFEH